MHQAILARAARNADVIRKCPLAITPQTPGGPRSDSVGRAVDPRRLVPIHAVGRQLPLFAVRGVFGDVCVFCGPRASCASCNRRGRINCSVTPAVEASHSKSHGSSNWLVNELRFLESTTTRHTRSVTHSAWSPIYGAGYRSRSKWDCGLARVEYCPSCEPGSALRRQHGTIQVARKLLNTGTWFPASSRTHPGARTRHLVRKAADRSRAAELLAA